MTSPTLIGVPYDGSSSFLRGAALAPPRIREALWTPAGNPFSESLVDLSAPGAVGDAGDLPLGRFLPSEGDAARAAISEGVARVVTGGGAPIALGGDHSITYPLVRGVRSVSERARRGLTILHVDAHPDLNELFEGDRYSHACPFARILEEGLVERLVQIGIRTMTEHQRAQADRYGVEVIDMPRWVAGARPAIEGAVYVSIDLDGLDPAFAPGVSHREAGGLSVREVLTEIQRLAGPIVGADVVEYNPLADVDGRTAPVAAKLVKELASRMIETG